MKWSFTDTQLASGGNDNKLYVWDMHSDTPICRCVYQTSLYFAGPHDLKWHTTGSRSILPLSKRSRGRHTSMGCWHPAAVRQTGASGSGTRSTTPRSTKLTQDRRCATSSGRRTSMRSSARTGILSIKSLSGAIRPCRKWRRSLGTHSEYCIWQCLLTARRLSRGQVTRRCGSGTCFQDLATESALALGRVC